MEIAIVTQNLRFMVAETPNQRRDWESKAPKTTAEGAPVFQAVLLTMDGQLSAPVKVTVVGDPGVAQGQFVTPQGLRLHVIDRRGDSVMWWTAERLIPVGVSDGGPAEVRPGPRGQKAAER